MRATRRKTGAVVDGESISRQRLLEDLGSFDLSQISWAIVGGESGLGARPMQKDWVISIRDQCHEANVPFFFKQWGGVRKKKNGRELDGRTYDEYPARVTSSIPERESCVAFARECMISSPTL
jgi:protein gp37